MQTDNEIKQEFAVKHKSSFESFENALRLLETSKSVAFKCRKNSCKDTEGAEFDRRAENFLCRSKDPKRQEEGKSEVSIKRFDHHCENASMLFSSKSISSITVDKNIKDAPEFRETVSIHVQPSNLVTSSHT